MSPQGSDLVLTSDIPDGEVDVLVLDRLDVEPDGGDGGDDLAELELVEDGGLAGGVEAKRVGGADEREAEGVRARDRGGGCARGHTRP